jgi:hypothetical protein
MDNDTPKRFLDRPPAGPTLPRDSAEAEAAVAAFIRGDSEFWPRAELEALRQRVQALRDPLAPDSLDVLARQLPTLEAMWQFFAVQSVRASSPEHKLKMVKAALHAQQAFARTFALLRTLKHQQAGAKAAVNLIDGPDNDSAPDSD